MQRMALFRSIRLALCLLTAGVLLASCKPAQSPTPSGESKPALKVAFAYIGPVGDGGWTFVHDNARKALQKEFGNRIETSFVENVPVSGEAENVIRNMARQGNGLIFGTTFDYMEQMRHVAAEFPAVKFEHATGYKTANNLSTYDSRTYEGAYMSGIIAGRMTTSNILGVVASVPIAEVIRNINSFTLGAQSSNPHIKTRVVWVGEWFNPTKEGQAAQELMAAGADVLFQNTDSPAVLKAAEARGKRAFGWDSDMSAYGPKAHLASSIINWAPYYIKTTRDVLDGTWKSGQSWWGVKEGAIDIVALAPDIPADTRQRVDAIKQGLKDGSFVIWKGPVHDNTGKEILKKDQRADDAFLRAVNFYVQGVEGQVPKAP